MPIPPSITASRSCRCYGGGLIFLLCLVFLLGTGAAHADPGVAYTTAWGYLCVVDLETGKIQEIGWMDIHFDTLIALTWGPDGFLYGLGRPHPTNTLYRIDPATGATALVGYLGTQYASGLAFDADGTLWLSASKYPTGTLYRVDPETAVATAVRHLKMGVKQLLFHGDQLYGFSSELVEIDRVSGVVTPVHLIGGLGAHLTGAAFDSEGTLWLTTQPPTVDFINAFDYYRVLNFPEGEFTQIFHGVVDEDDMRGWTRGLAMTSGRQVVEIPTLDAVGGVAFAVLLVAGGFWVAARRSRKLA